MNDLFIYAPLAALLLDTLLGDPRSAYHPVVLIGKLIGALEKQLLNELHSDRQKLWRGGLLVVIVLSVVYLLAYLLMTLAAQFGAINAWGMSALLLYFTISPRSLAEAGREIRDYIYAGDLVNARRKVGWIVGRDTDRLDVPNITRATVETIAENIVDGIISPLFYFCLGGAPLAMLYRAVNTMDSMIAYKNVKYLYFGRIAAKTDDIFNFIPARLTAVLLVICAFIYRFDYRNAVRIIRRDAASHPSPNSGYSEAAVAGSLGVRLGGLNYYFGIPSHRAYMGDERVVLAPEHITKTIAIMYGVTILFIFLYILFSNVYYGALT